MNPNQQGYYTPDPAEPAQPLQPAQPVPQQAAPAAAPQQAVSPASAQQSQQVASVPQPPAPTPAGELPVSPEQLPDTTPDPVADEPVELTDEPVTWSALEYIHREKGAAWFTAFGIITVILLGVTIFFQQWSFALVIIAIVAVIIVSSRRPPRELAYGLSDEGLSIDGKMHPFENFKAFGVIRDGEEYSVMLIPTQRFQPGVTVYFPEEAGEDIVDMLGSRLPMKDLHLDAVDRVVRLLRL